MIIPSLIVGLGTTGTDILIELRRLIFEEFGEPGLPVVKMVAIETNENKDTSDRNINIDYNKPHHKIDMIHIGIPSTGPIKQMLNPNSPSYHPGLKEWLDPVILNQMHYKDGAGQIRMAGRLCLWLSWNEVQNHLTKALRSLQSKQNKLSTIDDILTPYCARKNIQMPTNPIGNSPNVTIVGTFCGGTCSGIFIDVAYLLRNIMGNQGLNPYVSGIFTIPDQTMAQQPKYYRDAVNCYSALFELDYYHNPNRKKSNRNKPIFDILPIPNGNPIQDDSPPLDAVRVESPMGQADGEAPFIIVGPDGKPDPEPLNFMVALNMFMDIGNQTYQAKKDVRANVITSDDFNIVPINGAGHRQFMSAFGLSALWYPKYKIIHAVAIKLAMDLIDTWLAASSNQDSSAARNAATNFQIDNLFSAIHPDSEFKDAISKNIQKLKTTDDSLLETEIQKIKASNGTSFIQQLQPEGDLFSQYDRELVGNANSAKKLLDNFYISLLNKLSNDFTCISAIENSLRNLDDRLSREINELPQSAPEIVGVTNDPDLKRLLKQIRKIKTDNWLRLLRLRKDAIEQKKEQYIQKYQKILMGKFDQIRKYYTRQIYEDMRRYLGVAPELGDAKLFYFQETLWQQFSRLRSEMNKAKNHLANEYGKVKQIPNYPSISISGNYKQEIANIYAKLRQRLLGNTLTHTLPQIITAYKVRNLAGIIQKPGNELADSILGFFQSQVNLHMPPRIDPIKKYNSSNANLKQLFSTNSQPMMQIQITPNPPAIRNPDIITGPNPAGIQKLLISLGVSNLKALPSDYDNFVAVYRECGPFSLDQMRVYRSWKDLYENYNQKRRDNQAQNYPVHTRIQGFPKPIPQDPMFFNWLKVAQLFNDELGVFTKDSFGILFRYYTDGNGSKTKFVTDPDSQSYNDFIQSAQNRSDLTNKIKDACQKIGKDRFIELINAHFEKNFRDPESNVFTRESEFFTHRITELFNGYA